MYGAPYPFTVRANAVLLDDEVVGIIGVAKHPEWGIFFTDYREDLQPHLSSVTIWRCIKDAMKIVEGYAGPLLSQASNVEGCINLNRLGFFHLHGAWYGWPKQSHS
jgi:hypothetical protein